MRQRDVPQSIIEVNTRTGAYRQVADLGAFRRAHPVTVPDEDLEPEGVYFSLKPPSANSMSSTSTPVDCSKCASTAASC